MLNTKLLLIWNIVLTLLVVVLLWGISALSQETNNLSSHNTAQNVVLCGYLEDIKAKTGVDRTVSPNCQGDIELIYDLNTK